MKLRLHWMVGAVALLGCGDARLVGTFVDSTTRIRLSPSAFRGEVPCVPRTAGALQSYVVSFVDVTDRGSGDAGAAPEPEPIRSPPVACDQAVQFTAQFRRSYAADIRAFDTAPGDTDPDGSPRWTATCGRGTPGHDDETGPDPLGPTEAVFGRTIPMRGCTPLLASGGETATRVEVNLAEALGNLTCGSEPGSVGFFEATLEAETRRAACSETITFELDERQIGYVTVDVVAFESVASDAGLFDAGVADAASPPSSPWLDAAPPADAAPAPTSSTDAGDAGELDAGAPPDASGGSEPVPEPGGGALFDSATPPSTPPLAGVPRWSTRCVARTVAGATTRASCEPLRPLAGD